MSNSVDYFSNVLQDRFKNHNIIIDLLMKISGVRNFQNDIDFFGENLNLKNHDDLNKFLSNLEINVKIHKKHNFLKEQFLIVSNHPLGALDGILMQKVIQEIGLTGKTLADEIFEKFEQTKDITLGIPIRNENKSKISSFRKMKLEIKDGNSLAMFPSGTVAGFNFKEMKFSDYDWDPGFIEIAKSNSINILPVYIDANRLSVLHYICRIIYPDFASLRLLNENSQFIKRSKGSTINIIVGDPINIDSFDVTKENASILREICLKLKGK